MASGIENIGLWAPVDKDGNIYQTPTADNTSKSTRGTNELGKDAFLQLLVAQMKYQDPLNPTSDTEWISQMATFSTLEEMQNMNTTLGNSQALSLVGKTVIINSEDTLVGGKVDYVVMQKGKAYLAINDSLYSIDDLDTVADEDYLDKLKEDGKLDNNKTDTDKTDTDETDKDKTDTEKILDSIREMGDKLDAIGSSMESAAKAFTDAAASLAGTPGSGSTTGPTDTESRPNAENKTEIPDSTENKTESTVKDEAENKTEESTQSGAENKTEGTEENTADETETAENAAESGAVEPENPEINETESETEENPDTEDIVTE